MPPLGPVWPLARFLARGSGLRFLPRLTEIKQPHTRSTRSLPVTNSPICSLHITPELPVLQYMHRTTSASIRTHRNLTSIAPAYRRQQDAHQQGPIWMPCFLGAFSVRALFLLFFRAFCAFCAFVLSCYRALCWKFPSPALSRGFFREIISGVRVKRAVRTQANSKHLLVSGY